MNPDAQHNPPYLPVGTEVSAKYKGAFCEAKIRKIVRVVKCKVTFKAGLGSATLLDDQIKGTLRIGNTVEAKHHDKNQFVEGTINKIQDCSQYTVVFDDGDITTLRRSALVLKSSRHFNESETLDQLPLTHPEHFSNPVVGGRRGVRRRAANTEDNDRDDSSEDEDIPVKKGRKKPLKEADMGKVVCVDSTDKKKSKDNWFPALVVSPSAQETVKIRTKDEYLVRSFRDGRYYTVPKKETTGFTKDSAHKSELISNVLRTACEKAVQYLEKNELPPHWDRDVLFGHLNASNSDDGQSESESSEDDPREEKDRFVAQLYKFMDERATPINKVPTVCNKDLDFYKLYKIVTSKGGYNKVSNSSQWKPVTIKMGYGTMPTTSTINLVKQAYKKFLQNFEEFYRKLGCSFITSVDSRPSSAAGTSRSNRSLFRERHASSTVKEIKKVEEIKIEKEVEEKRTSPIIDNTETDSVLSDTGSKMSEQSEESSRRSRSRLDSSRSKKDSDESSEKQDKPIPATKSKRVYKKKSDIAAAAAAASVPAPPTVATTVISKASNDVEKGANESTTPLATPTIVLPPAAVIVTPTTREVPTTGVTSVSPGPIIGGGGKRGGRGKYNKKKEKEPPIEQPESKSEVEKSTTPTSAHIGKNVKIQVGDKLQVYYGPQSEGNVTYEAKVVDIDELEQKYLVHYTGWNTRYDEWIKRYRISSLSIGSKQDKSSEGGIRQQQEGGKGLSDSNSDLEAAQQSQNSNKPPNIPKTTTTTRRKGRPLSGSQTTTTISTTATSSGSGTSSTSSKLGGVRRRQPSESEKVRVKRRPRRKSGQDSSFTQSGSGSGVDDSSEDDSEDEGAANSPTNIKPPVTSTNSPSSLRASKGNSRNNNKKLIEDDDASSVSSSTSSGTNKQLSKLEPAAGMTISASAVTSIGSTNNTSQLQNQVLDLNQIRSELKGLDKMVKAPQQQQQTSSSSLITLNAPTAPITTGAIPIIVVPQSSDDKLDIYEFQDDANDTPKLKMFSPRSPEKKDETVNKCSLSGENLSKIAQQGIQEDATNNTCKETSVLGTSPSAIVAVTTATSSFPTTSGNVAAKPFPLTVQMLTKVEAIKGGKKDSSSADMLTTTKPKPTGHGSKTSNISTTPPHSFHGAISIASPGHSTSGVAAAKMLNITGVASSMAQVNTAIETKSPLRMITPVHTLQQPLRQRAILSHSFPPPPLIPSSLNNVPPKPVLPVPIQPRSNVPSSPPMPSLIQRPPISSSSVLCTSPINPLPTNQQHLRPITPTNLSTTDRTSPNLMGLSPTSGFQAAGTPGVAVLVRTVESKSPSFASRQQQQELFPNLIQQQQSKHSGKSSTMPTSQLTTNMSHSSASVNISLSPIPISSISPSQTMFHSSTSTTTPSTAIKGESITKGQGLPLKSSGGDSMVPVGSSSHSTLTGPPLPKKPNLKRKKPVKDKNRMVDNQFATSIILPDIVTGSVSNLSKPKKKPKKVITKNIIDLQKDESSLKELEEQMITKKPRKPSKKKLKLEKVDSPLIIVSTKIKMIQEKHVKTKEKQPRRKNNNKGDNVTGTMPLQQAKGKTTPVHSATVTSNIGSPHYLLATTSAATSTSMIDRMASSSTVTVPEQGLVKTSEVHHPVLESKKLKGIPLGVLKSAEKKSYAPKMSAATAARVISCIDNVAKLPVDSSFTTTSPSSSVKVDQLSSQKLPVIITALPTTAGSMSTSKSILNVVPSQTSGVIGKIQPDFSGFQASTPTTSLTISKVPKLSGDSRVLSSTDIKLPHMMTKPTTLFPTSTVTTTLVISSSNEFISGSSNQNQKNSKLVTVVSTGQEMANLSASLSGTTAVNKNLEIKEEKNLVSSFSSISSSAGGDEISSLFVGCVTRDSNKEAASKSRVVSNPIVLKNEDKLKSKDFASISTVVTEIKDLSTTKEEDESCHSLLCEEIIPGSPGSGVDDDSPFGGIDDENARIHSPGHTIGVKKDQGSTSFNSSHSPQSHQRNQSYSGKEKGEDSGTNFRTVDSSSVRKEDSKDFDMKAEDEMMVGHNKSNRNFGTSAESNLSILQTHREVGKAAQSLLSLSGIERPTTSGNGGFNNSHPTVQHVMDNTQRHIIISTPPTTPESSSISSGSPRVDGGRVSPTNDHPSSSKSKDSSDGDSADNQKLSEAAEEGFSSDAGRKSSKGRSISSPQKKKHIESSGRNSTRSPPLKRRRIQRKKSPDEVIRSYSYRGRGSGGRKGNLSNDNEHHGRTLPPPPLNLTKPPLSNKFNYIPDLDGDLESEHRIQAYQQALQDIKEKYLEIKAEMASFERRRRRTNKKRKKDAVLINKIS